MAEFKPVFKPSSRARIFFDPKNLPVFLMSDGFKLQTIVLGGALLQIILFIALPMRWAVVPASAMLLHSLSLTIIQSLSPSKNTFMHGVVPGRVTAQMPSTDPDATSSHGSVPAAESLVVFNLGIQYNHPMGMLAPHVKELGDRFQAMEKDLRKRKAELGLLDLSFWRGGDRSSNNNTLLTMVFKDVADLHRFAHEPLHRDTWDWWHKVGSPKHIGILHETYCVPRGAYETVYVNCRPTLLGRGQVRTKAAGGEEGKGEDEEVWQSTLVSADMPALKTQYARMNRFENGVAKE